MTNFLAKQRKELGDDLARVDCEDVASEAIDKVVESLYCNHFNDRRQFLSEEKTRKDLVEFVSASRCDLLLANLGNL